MCIWKLVGVREQEKLSKKMRALETLVQAKKDPSDESISDAVMLDINQLYSFVLLIFASNLTD